MTCGVAPAEESLVKHLFVSSKANNPRRYGVEALMSFDLSILKNTGPLIASDRQ